MPSTTPRPGDPTPLYDRGLLPKRRPPSRATASSASATRPDQVLRVVGCHFGCRPRLVRTGKLSFPPKTHHPARALAPNATFLKSGVHASPRTLAGQSIIDQIVRAAEPVFLHRI